MSENKFWVTIVSIIVGGIVALVLGGMLITMHHEAEMARLGYQETAHPGTAATTWEKK